MEIGYILYKNKSVKVTVLQRTADSTIIETEDNELMEIPEEAHIAIWPTKEICEAHKND